jgi:hypothetical protein
MEVYHHSHTARKKWAHYFWEFLMLFLAVFCGFLAEYKLEHVIEHKREKEYVVSMIEDLESDTAKIAELEIMLHEYGNSIDTVLLFFNALGDPSNLALTRNIYSILGYPEFIYTDRTIQQLKSSGAMRLIRNKTAADEILNYDAEIRRNQNDIAMLNDLFRHLTLLRISIINLQLLSKQDYKQKTLEEKKNSEQNYLFTKDAVLLKNFRSAIYEIRLAHSGSRSRYLVLKEKATFLIIALKKEYHLK